MLGGFAGGLMGGASVQIVISAVDKYSQELNKANKSLTALKVAATVAATGFIALAGASVKLAADLEMTRIGFTSLTGSADVANKLLKDLAAFARKTPFTIVGVEAVAKQLLAVGVEAKDVIPILKSVGDVAAALGLREEGLQRLIWNLGQVKALGKLTGRELRDFANNAVPMLDMLADSMGKTKAEIQEMVTVGKVGYQDVIDALQKATSEGGKFENFMFKAMGTTVQMWSNLKDAITEAGRAIGSNFLAPVNAAIKAATDLVNKFNELPTEQKAGIAKGAGILGVGAVGTVGALAVSKMVRGQTKMTPMYVEEVGISKYTGAAGGAAGGALAAGGVGMMGMVGAVIAGATIGTAVGEATANIPVIEAANTKIIKTFIQGLDAIGIETETTKNFMFGLAYGESQVSRALEEGIITQENYNKIIEDGIITATEAKSVMDLMSEAEKNAAASTNQVTDAMDEMASRAIEIADRMLIQGSQGNYMTQQQATSTGPLIYLGNGQWGPAPGGYRPPTTTGGITVNLDGQNIGGALNAQVASQA